MIAVGTLLTSCRLGRRHNRPLYRRMSIFRLEGVYWLYSFPVFHRHWALDPVGTGNLISAKFSAVHIIQNNNNYNNYTSQIKNSTHAMTRLPSNLRPTTRAKKI